MTNCLRVGAATLLPMSLIALSLAAAPLVAGAQPRPDPAQRPEPAPQSAPGNPGAAPPEKIAPAPNPREDSGSSGEPLGDRLSRSNGTITPPRDVDPGMTTQPPDPGPRSMPVLPPPGTGGNSTVTPK
jgi:hypothetical protein